MPQTYVHPLDPNCPAVKEFTTKLMQDPMTHASGAPVDDIMEGFTRKHRIICLRCQDYGAANIYVKGRNQ